MGGASLRLSQMAALLLLAVIALLPSSTVAQGVPEMAGCDERGINCVEVTTPGNLTFQCRVAGPEDGTPVLLLHGWVPAGPISRPPRFISCSSLQVITSISHGIGASAILVSILTINPHLPDLCRFPEFSIYWQPLLEYWADENRSDTNTLRAVACDLRGYSPLASPDSPDEYLYETLAGDVYAIADSMGIDAFHLVGHDHGAGLGWLVAAMNTDQRVLSYTAMSLPHPRALSAALHGPDRVEEQLVRPAILRLSFPFGRALASVPTHLQLDRRRLEYRFWGYSVRPLSPLSDTDSAPRAPTLRRPSISRPAWSLCVLRRKGVVFTLTVRPLIHP